MYDHTFLILQITRSDIRPHMKVGCQPGDCIWLLNLPQEFVWVCMDKHTHFITPKGDIIRIMVYLKIFDRHLQAMYWYGSNNSLIYQCIYWQRSLNKLWTKCFRHLILVLQIMATQLSLVPTTGNECPRRCKINDQEHLMHTNCKLKGTQRIRNV